MGEGAGGGRPLPAEGIRDWANWKGLELRGQEGGGDYLRVGGPRGRGSQEGVLPGSWMGVQEPLAWSQVCRPTELDTQR